jgi:hypothetical protein
MGEDPVSTWADAKVELNSGRKRNQVILIRLLLDCVMDLL